MSKTFIYIIITILSYFTYREGEGIPRFRRPRFIPASDNSSEPKLKKQKQDHTVDAGINCVPVSILSPPWSVI